MEYLILSCSWCALAFIASVMELPHAAIVGAKGAVQAHQVVTGMLMQMKTPYFEWQCDSLNSTRFKKVGSKLKLPGWGTYIHFQLIPERSIRKAQVCFGTVLAKASRRGWAANCRDSPPTAAKGAAVATAGPH